MIEDVTGNGSQAQLECESNILRIPEAVWNQER